MIQTNTSRIEKLHLHTVCRDLSRQKKALKHTLRWSMLNRSMNCGMWSMTKTKDLAKESVAFHTESFLHLRKKIDRGSNNCLQISVRKRRKNFHRISQLTSNFYSVTWSWNTVIEEVAQCPKATKARGLILLLKTFRYHLKLQCLGFSLICPIKIVTITYPDQ